METFSSNLYARMQAEIQNVSLAVQSPLKGAEQSYNIVCAHLLELKEFARDYEFKNLEDEIRFFKEIKPLFLKEIIYFMKVFEIESARPVGGIEMQKAYFFRLLGQFQDYFEQHRFLYMYYQTNKNHLDSSMFVRNPKEFPLFPQYCLDNDSEFSNVYSFKLGKIRAFEDIITYLQSMLYSLDPGNSSLPVPTQKARTPLIFTGNNAQFIELVYALQSAGVFNNGKADVKQVMEWMQYCFNIKVTNYYGYFQSMRIRKKSRTPFMDYLIEKLKRRMDDSDENPQYK